MLNLKAYRSVLIGRPVTRVFRQEFIRVINQLDGTSNKSFFQSGIRMEMRGLRYSPGRKPGVPPVTNSSKTRVPGPV